MDKLDESVFGSLMASQDHRRQPYCFDKCFNTFEKEITQPQYNCISKCLSIIETCVKKYQNSVKLIRGK